LASTSPTPSSTSPPVSAASSSRSKGTTGGIVGGVLGGLILVGAPAFLIWRRRRRNSQTKHVPLGQVPTDSYSDQHRGLTEIQGAEVSRYEVAGKEVEKVAEMPTQRPPVELDAGHIRRY
jgi:LPXTG-motif cell wall-anchored protein